MKPRIGGMLVAVCAALVTLSACNSVTGPGEEGLYAVQVPSGDTLGVKILDPSQIGNLSLAIHVGDGFFLIGDVARGSAGYNKLWSWHLDPASVRFAVATTDDIKACQVAPQVVERDVDRWIATVKLYCSSVGVLERR